VQDVGAAIKASREQSRRCRTCGHSKQSPEPHRPLLLYVDTSTGAGFQASGKRTQCLRIQRLVEGYSLAYVVAFHSNHYFGYALDKAREHWVVYDSLGGQPNVRKAPGFDPENSAAVNICSLLYIRQ